MTYSDSGKRDTLYYRLLSGSTEDPGLWGNEYVRHLAAELGEEYLLLSSPSQDDLDSEDAIAKDGETSGEKRTPPSKETLLSLAMDVLPFFLKHNAEADAVDLLLELEAIEKIVDHVDGDTYKRVCLYMVS
jgi:26S proteasome regulatory subunit N1